MKLPLLAAALLALGVWALLSKGSGVPTRLAAAALIALVFVAIFVGVHTV